MNKSEILDSIRRIAAANSGKAPGSQRVATETGLRRADWYPKLWVRWSDAVREAGLQPNSLTAAASDEDLINRHIALIRQLRRFPIESDLRLESGYRGISSLGRKRERVTKVLEFCRARRGFDDVIALCETVLGSKPSPRERAEAPSARGLGYVYLIKHGNRAEYKIGRTLNPIRREGEIRLELPERLQPVHFIKTDDPSGVEAYWHQRFADRRKQGEWFALALDDVRAFKRWKKIF
jgi:hypothetical protein